MRSASKQSGPFRSHSARLRGSAPSGLRIAGQHRRGGLPAGGQTPRVRRQQPGPAKTVPGAQVRHRDKAEIPRKNLPVYFVLRHAVECICAFHFPAQVVASCRRLNCAVTIKIGAQGLGPGPVLGNAAVIRARLLPL